MTIQGPCEILAKKSRFASVEELPKTDVLTDAVKHACSWLHQNGLRGKSAVKVFDYNGYRMFWAELDDHGEVITLWSRTREGIEAVRKVV